MTDRPAQSAPTCKPWCCTSPAQRFEHFGEGSHFRQPCSIECERAGRPLNPAPSAPPERPGDDTPWPLRDILTQLVSAANHLLHVHACDCDRWETIKSARDAAVEILQPAPPADGAGLSDKEGT